MAVEVRNAADRDQVKRATRNERTRSERRDAIWGQVLTGQDGRELVWMLLQDTRVFDSPLHASGSMVYYNIGRADVGRDLIAYLRSVHGANYLLMEQEARALDERIQRSREAAFQSPTQREDD